MDQFWQQAGQTVAIQQAYQPPHQQFTNNNEFDFSANQPQYTTQFQTQNYTQFTSNQQEEDQIAKNIRQEEQAIQRKLSQKANEEYELKQKRKDAGRKALEEFFAAKQQQIHQRKQENRVKQQQLLNEMKNSSSSQGWAKVTKSVDLKQSEYKGSKDINRMREAIMHKREDQSS